MTFQPFFVTVRARIFSLAASTLRRADSPGVRARRLEPQLVHDLDALFVRAETPLSPRDRSAGSSAVDNAQP